MRWVTEVEPDVDAVDAEVEAGGGGEHLISEAEAFWRRTLRDEAKAQGVELPAPREATSEEEDSVLEVKGTVLGVEDSTTYASVAPRALRHPDAPEGGLGLDEDDVATASVVWKSYRGEASVYKVTSSGLDHPRTMSTAASNGDDRSEGPEEAVVTDMCRTEGGQEDWLATKREDEVVFQDMVPAASASLPSGALSICDIVCSAPRWESRCGPCFGRRDADQVFADGTESWIEQVEMTGVSGVSAGFPWCFLCPAPIARAGTTSSII